MKVITLTFAIGLLTGCSSSSDPINPLAVVSDDELAQESTEESTSQPAPSTANDTNTVIPVEPEPEPEIVYPTPDPFYGLPMICGYGPAAPGSPPTEFMRFEIIEDGTYVTSSIPNRTGEMTGSWSYAQNVIYLDGTDWIIDGNTLTRNGATCTEELFETLTEDASTII